ncbi:diacylglycerol/lipid kinase family protein [Zeaxanthinibacter enoshimensis]|uniref:YegS/Rv2252/BmrU family lipid kinase n=1 Tax=Zeaxanthinibacter enoshimensis TaxID=392009 RepID=A0A4R6TLA6_9FLAO|nr:diacylglycerol kinase family protein [Zeaxanthinibacter enoshimensis]TDQ32232.1 YegS/Rv2252/BmrU family lipid kinase [Zeaxanthinibacter enoshimensis]
MKVLLVINPVSGNSDKQNLLGTIKREALLQNISLDIYTTTGKNDDEKIEELLSGTSYELLVALGGDGTVNRAALHARKHELLFGIIPGGTANGLAKDLGIPSDPVEAFRQAIEQKHKIWMDMIQVNEKYHLLHLGDIGANANLIARMENSKKDTLHNAANFIQEFLEGGSFDYTLETDEGSYKGNASMVSFCNARKYGTGIPLTKDAAPNDGKFEVVIFKEIAVSTLLKSALAAIEESLFPDEDRQIISTTSAVINLTEARQWQLDGELMPPARQIRLKILPRQLRMICGEECPYTVDAC